MKLATALACAAVLFTSSFVALSHAQDKGGPDDKRPGQEGRDHQGRPEMTPEQKEKRMIARQLASYPLTSCPTSGEALDANAVNVMHEGRLVRFCCNKCADAFKKDPAATLKKVDEAVIAAQKAHYPMEKCPVSGDVLGADAVNHVHGTRLIRFCSAKCVDAFVKNPEESLRKLDNAYMASQRADYPLKTCLIMTDERLDGDEEPIDYLYGNRLIRFCCKKCVRKFEEDSTKWIAKLDEAAALAKRDAKHEEKKNEKKEEKRN